MMSDGVNPAWLGMNKIVSELFNGLKVILPQLTHRACWEYLLNKIVLFSKKRTQLRAYRALF